MLREGIAFEQKLSELRRLYEPYADALARYLLMPLPKWLSDKQAFDNWQTSAWEKISAGGLTPTRQDDDEHF
jgi:hypothetical protein